MSTIQQERLSHIVRLLDNGGALPHTADEGNVGLTEAYVVSDSSTASGHDHDSLWGFVQSRTQAQDEDDAGSMVLVSRASSPWPVEFGRVRTPSPRGVRVVWPSTLPWLQFQTLYLKKAMPCPSRQNISQDKFDMLRNALLARMAIKEEGEGSDQDQQGGGGDNFGLDTTALITAMGPRALHVVSRDASVGRAAAEIAKSVPEAYKGEHQAGLEALLSGDVEEAKVAAFRMLVYQVSNNLVDDNYDDDDYDNKYARIVHLFRNTGLPRDTWEEHFATKQDRSSRAFTEKLFEAAVNAQDLQIAEGLLRSGVDPNQAIMSYMNCCFERPIQVATDSRVRNIELAMLLIKHGANVDLTTRDNDKPAIHYTAARGSFEMVRLLVESGANIYRGHMEVGYSWEDTRTPLSFAADRWLFSLSSPARSTSRNLNGANDVEPESEGTKVLRYLAGLHQKGTFPKWDESLIQGALIIAAGHSDPCLVRVLHEAGGDVTKPNKHGITPLVVAASHYKGDTRVVSYLLDHGAPVNEPPPRPSALHFAAARGSKKIVTLLIDRGADINTPAELTPLHKCLLGEHFIPPGGRKMAKGRYYTPLQLALHRVDESRLYAHNDTKTDEAAIAILEAGARLLGGELVLAVRFLSRRLVGALLDRGAIPSEVAAADPTGRSSSSSSALQAALRAYQLRGHKGERVSDILLEAGAVVARGDIHLACAAGDLELARFLVDEAGHLEGDGGGDDTGPRGGESVLEAALCSRSRAMVAWALAHARIPYRSGALCAGVFLHARAGDDDEGILDALVEKRRDGGGGGRLLDPVLEATAVSMLAHHTAGKRPVFLVRLLKELGVRGNTCLLPFKDEYNSYVNLTRMSRVRSLAEKYSEPGWWRDPDLIRCSPLVPLMLTDVPGRRPVMRVLLRAGYRPDALCLFMAIINGTEVDVEDMIHCGAGVNQAVRHNLDTPLQLAVRLGKEDIVRLLLRRGADVNGLPAVLVPLFTPGGDPNEFRPRSALQVAVEEGHLEIIDVLLAAGADVNGPISLDGGATALQCAAAKGFIGIAKMLLERGADINAPRAERYGRTALEAAAEWGRLDVVHFLLEQGADTDSEDGVWQYLRAIRFAQRNGHQVAADLLREWRVLDRWERRSLCYHGLVDEVFVAPDDDLLDEFYGSYGGYDSCSDDGDNQEDEEVDDDEDEDPEVTDEDEDPEVTDGESDIDADQSNNGPGRVRR